MNEAQEQSSIDQSAELPSNNAAQTSENSREIMPPLVTMKKPVLIEGIGVPGWWGTAVLCLFISIASSAISLWVYDKRYSTKIVAVDLKGYVEGKAADFAAGKISQEETSKAIMQLGDLMKNIPANTAVITADVAVRNIETIKP